VQRFAKGLAAVVAALVSGAIATLALAWGFELLYRATGVSFFASALVWVSPMLFGWLVWVVFTGLFLVLFWRLFRLKGSQAPSNSTPHTDARPSAVPDQPPSARAGGRGR
jgi:hypothetical protein